jgi:hypothetical protein
VLAEEKSLDLESAPLLAYISLELRRVFIFIKLFNGDMTEVWL